MELLMKTIRVLGVFICFWAVGIMGSCAKKPPADGGTIIVAAAASLKNTLDREIIPAYQRSTGVSVEAVYDSSGKLQTQIENGLAADVFFSASQTQMDALVKGGFVQADAVRPLLENKLALIAKKGSAPAVRGFQDLANAGMLALGDPKSVPAGQYAEEALTKLGLWDAIRGSSEVSYGTNVTEVLSWVAAGSAELGVVYTTDAASNDGVIVLETLPDGLLSKPIIYPVAVTKAGKGPPEAALRFVAFLYTPEARAAFEKYGFSPLQ
jgi:molybdate transport system substrate-binding protein